MILITTLAGIIFLGYDTKWLAALGLIGGFLTPVILSTGQDNQLVLMSYMTILNANVLTIAFFKQWRLLNYLEFSLPGCCSRAGCLRTITNRNFG